MKPLLVVFARDPEPGRVKTRLAATIGFEQATSFYTAMVTDLLEMWMQQAASWNIEIHLDCHSFFYERFGFPTRVQQGEGLGDKIYHSLFNGLRGSRPAVALIGSDAPALRPEWLESLIAQPEDVVLGPTDDGGFWGILARRMVPAMFDGVRWSTAHTLNDTADACRSAGLSVGFGVQGWDVDEARDLARLRREGAPGPHLQQFLSALPADSLSPGPEE
jgi:rSAM/selenodomain-associated transferase 1